jgi:hypothetical protein
MISKVEKIVCLWYNRYISLSKMLVLVESVLESILVQLVSFSFIPKGIMEKLRRTIYNLP